MSFLRSDCFILTEGGRKRNANLPFPALSAGHGSPTAPNRSDLLPAARRTLFHTGQAGVIVTRAACRSGHQESVGRYRVVSARTGPAGFGAMAVGTKKGSHLWRG